MFMWSWFKRTLKHLYEDQRGNVLIYTTATLIPMATLVGIGIDFSRIQAAKRTLQNAIDTSAVAIAKQANFFDLTEIEAKTIATPYMDKYFQEASVGEVVDFTVTLNKALGTVRIDADVNVDTTILQAIGQSTISYRGVTKVSAGVRWLELVMVLDNSGSMGGSRLTALKDAANGLVNILFDEGETESSNVKIGLIPFSASVNVGVPQTTSWIDASGASAIHNENLDLSGTTLFDLFGQLGRTWGGCVRARDTANGFDLDDTVPDITIPGTLWAPYFAPDEPDTGEYSNNYLDDKVGDPPPPVEQIQRDIAKYTDPIFQGGGSPNYNCVPAEIQPLTNQKAIITSAINSMVARGSTVIPAGLVWGWRVLSPDEPFTEGEPYNNQKVVKAIVLLTDGGNFVGSGVNGHNGSHYSAYGHAGTGNHLGPPDGSQTAAVLNQKTEQICNNIKDNKDSDPNDEDIKLYTITFNLPPDSPVADRMKDCASDPNKYFDSPSNDDLQNVFYQIAGSLKQDLIIAK